MSLESAKSPSICIVRSCDTDLGDIRSLLRRMLFDLSQSFFPAWQLALRDLNSTYRQSILGFLWILMPPVVTTALWVGLSQAGIAQITTPGMPYAVFVTAGTLLWSLFADALNAPKNQVAGNIGSLQSLNFPPEAIIISGIIQILTNFAVRLIMLVGVAIWFQMPISYWAPLYLVFAFVILLCGLVIGLFFVPLASLYKDVGQVIALALPLFMYIAPVAYKVPDQGLLRMLMLANPLTYAINGARQSLTGPPDGTNILICIAIVLVCIVLGFVGWIVNRVTLPHLVERS